MPPAKDVYYAWSPIRVGTTKGELKTIAVGAKVTPSDLETDDDGFQTYLASGAVRPYPYPDIPDTNNPPSPIDFMRSKVLEGVESEEERLMALQAPEIVRAGYGPVEGETPMEEGVEPAEAPSG